MSAAPTPPPVLDHRQQARNLSSNYLALLVGFASVLVLTPLLVNHLGDVRFGIWVLVASVVGYLGLLDLGLRPSVVKYVAEYRATGDADELRAYVSTVFLLYLGGGLLAVLGGWLVGETAVDLLSLDPALGETVRTVFPIAGLCVALALQNGLAGGVLEGCSRYDLNNGISIAVQSLNFAGTVAIVALGGGLEALVALQAGAAAFGLALRLAAMKRRLGVEIAPRSFRVRALRTGLSYGAWAFLLGVATQIVFQTDHLIVSLVLSVGLVTTYAIAWRLVDAVNRVVLSTVNVLLPLVSGFGATDQIEQRRELFLEGTRVALAVAVPFYTVFVILGERLIAVWIGDGYDESYRILVLLSAAFLVHVPGHVTGVYLLGTGQHRVLALYSIGGAVLNLVLSVVLAHSIGLAGVALATGISFLATLGVLIPAHALRLAGVTLRSYLGVLAGPVLSGVAVGLAGAAVLPAPEGVAGLLLMAAALLVAYGLVLAFAGTPGAVRARYVRAVRKALGREPRPCD